MNQRQLHRVNNVLKFEQRNLDNCIRHLHQQNSILNAIRRELESISMMKQTTLQDHSTVSSFAINAVENRINFVQKLENSVVTLTKSETTQLATIELARKRVQDQKSRVTAIEKLVEKLKRESREKQTENELLELNDTIINQYLENAQ